MKKKTFLVTTPIFYPSGDLHIGHVYTTVMADVLTRYKADNGYDVFFITGSDEHGMKIEKKAKEKNLEPINFVEPLVNKFKKLWIDLNVRYSKFSRTTNKNHEEIVQKIFTILLKKNLIYLDFYKGYYCVSCEEFLTSSQIQDLKCIVCLNKPIITEEETYMLRVSKFKDFLIDLLKSDYITPKSRENEMINSFIDNNLEDLSVTRVSFKWGIQVSENPKHVIYVWIDALSNYITGLGYLTKNDLNFKKFWSEDTEILHIVGKEITRFFSIYWPVILHGLGLRMPTKLLSHGWILSGGLKMSKSLGNVVDPYELISKYGSDAVRFYCSYNIPYQTDGDISDDSMKESYNINLANNIGNLFSRVSNMIINDFNGKLTPINLLEKESFILLKDIFLNYHKHMDEYNISNAISEVLKLASYCNKYIEDFKPWELKKNGSLKEVNNFLYELQYCLSAINLMMKPILVDTFPEMTLQLGLLNSFNEENILNQQLVFNKITEKKIFFKRLK